MAKRPVECTEAVDLRQGQDSESAIHALRLRLEADPDDFLAWNDLGVLLFMQSDYADAERSFARALQFDSKFPASLRGRAEALLRLGRHADAIEYLTLYLKSDLNCLGAKLSLIECLYKLGRLDEASELAEHCLRVENQSTRLLMLAAAIYQRQRLPGKVLTAVQNAVALKPGDVELRAQLALAYWEFGTIGDALRERDVLMSMNPCRSLRSSLAWLSLHDPDQTPEGLVQIHKEAASDYIRADALQVAPKAFLSTETPLRIGYVSGEFIGGPAFCFLSSWLKHIDRVQFHSTFYSSRPALGAKQAAFKKMADEWREISNLSDTDLNHLIRRDKIDILVDLSGHYEGNRLPVFASRPAPVSVAFPNYPSTTGMNQIDYIFTDIWTTPAGSEKEYTEIPYRLASGYLAYESPVSVPAVQPLPSLRNGFITLGLFQRPSKYNTKFWDTLGEIMRRQANAVLLIHFASADLDNPHSRQRQFLEHILRERNIQADRLRFAGNRSELEHLEVVAQADVALDSFPYNGQTTTCDCLWMGVPVVTLRGHTHVSRVGSSLLHRVDLARLVAHSEEAYIAAVLSLASDLPALSQLRARLARDAPQKLGDGARLAREISDAYLWMKKRSLLT